MPQDGWRWCRNCSILFYGGTGSGGRCGATGGPHDGSQSGNYSLNHDESNCGESGWRWCCNCQQLHWPEGPPGSCPATGGPHTTSGSGVYSIPILHAGFPSGAQAGWRWCEPCQSLWYAYAGGNRCKYGRPHQATREHRNQYALRQEGSTGGYVPQVQVGQVYSPSAFPVPGMAPAYPAVPGYSPTPFPAPGMPPVAPSHGGHSCSGHRLTSPQDGWRWCRQCSVLFFGGTGNMGRCGATGGSHDSSGSGNYALQHNGSNVGEDGWRWCCNCQQLHWPSGPPGSCPAAGGGPHSTSGSGNYSLHAVQSGFGPGTQTGWRWCEPCGALWYCQGGGNRCKFGRPHEATREHKNQYALTQV